MARTRNIKGSGNVFTDLGFPPEEAVILAMRADLMAKLRNHIADRGWTQSEAAGKLSVTQSRISDLVRGKWEKFSLDMLLILASRAGLQPRLILNQAA